MLVVVQCERKSWSDVGSESESESEGVCSWNVDQQHASKHMDSRVFDNLKAEPRSNVAGSLNVKLCILVNVRVLSVVITLLTTTLLSGTLQTLVYQPLHHLL